MYILWNYFSRQIYLNGFRISKLNNYFVIYIPNIWLKNFVQNDFL
jgi:hypothetical protein